MYRKKNIVIITMCVAILLMIVGYAAFSTSLKINGTGKITSVWDIYFESVTLSSTVGTASEASNPTISNTSISFNINLRKPGDKVVYKAILKNAGTVDAKVSEINAEAKGTAAIINTVTGIKKGDTISAGTSTTITITVEYDKTITTVPSITTNELTINIECIQPDQSITNEDLVVYQPTLKVATITSGDTQPFLGGPILKNTIESIIFTNSKTVPSGVKGSWDVSAAGDGKVMAWYTDSDSDGLYEVVIGQDGGVIANPNSSFLFYYLINVESIDFTNFDTSLVTNMRFMFAHLRKVTTLDLSHFDTSKVTRMDNMFENCLTLKNLDLGNFDTSLVTAMGFMFKDCQSIASLNLSHFDTSKVTGMNNMFTNCRSLTKLDISHFDTSKVTTFSEMFYYCSSLTYLDLSHFDTSSVTTMYGMFQYANLKDGLDVSNFNTSKVTNMMAMFMQTKMSSLDLSSFDTSKVTTVNSMFRICSNLKNLDFSAATFGAVTNYNYMFEGVSTINIAVKSSTEQAWILDKISTANVVIA